MVEIEQYYSVARVAEILGCSKWTVREYLRTKKLQGIKPGGTDWRVSETNLKKFLEENHG